MTDTTDLRDALDAAIASYDRPAAVAVALKAVEDGSMPVEDLYRLLSRMLVEIGAAWQRGTAEVWQEHFATGVVRTIVESCARVVEAEAPRDRTMTIVLAAPPEEYHDLGLRMLADRFSLAGWRSHFLGADVPVRELVAATTELSADAVAVSASTHYHRTKLREYVDEFAASRPQVRIWVGGPAFAHEHDGWSDDMVLDPGSIPPPGGR